MSWFRLIPWVSLLLLGACAPLPKAIPLEAAERQAVAEGRITVTRQRTPGFLFTTPAKALVDSGMYEWSDPDKAISWGSVTRRHGVPDFTDAMQQAFFEALGSHSRAATFERAEQPEPWAESADFSRLAGKFNSDYVLEFRTMNGIFGYKPLAWKTYQMNYFGEVILIRLRDQQPVWKASCSARAEDENPLTLPGEDFLKGDGARLRAAAAFATRTCGEQLAAAFRAI